MIVRFSVTNFRSYKGETVLDFVSSTKIKKYPDHEKHFGRLSVVKNIGIFGSNAFGKSNILNAIGAMVNLIINGSCDENLAFIDDSTKPTKFSIVFLNNDEKFYEYSFSVKKENLMSPFIISDEELYQVFLNGSSQLIYNSKLGLQNIDTEALKVFASAYNNAPNQLFLRYINALERQDKQSSTSKLLKSIYDFFVFNIYVQLDGFPIMHLINEESIDNAKEYLKKYDIGLENVSFIGCTSEEYLRVVNDPIFPMIRNEFLKQPALKTQYFNDLKNIYCISRNGNTYTFKKLSFKHKGIKKEFCYGYESNGTKRIFALLALLMNEKGNSNRTIVIDEIERSAFPEIAHRLLEDFQSAYKQYNTQIVFSTHLTSLLKDALRRDEIYFVDKNGLGISSLYSLAEFKNTTKDNILKMFNEGAFGAIPKIGVNVDHGSSN